MKIEDRQITVEETENGFMARLNGYEIDADAKRHWISKNWVFVDLDAVLAKAKELLTNKD